MQIVCAKCKLNISYVYNWEGKSYCPDCIESVSGINTFRWVVIDGKPDTDKTIKAEEKRVIAWENHLKWREDNIQGEKERKDLLKELMYEDGKLMYPNCK